MAIFHLSAKIISRGEGRSAVAAAAYRHCAKMEDERYGRTVDYSHKGGNVHNEFALPEGAPEWAKSLIGGGASQASAEFWNAVEDFEKRSDAQLAKEIELALPVELSREQNIELVRAFVADQLLAKGMVADWSYHDIEGNPHVHIMTTLRPLEEAGFGPKKVATLDENGDPVRNTKGKIIYELWAGSKDNLSELRAAWADIQNAHLQAHGFDTRVDHRSYAAQGIELEPTTKVGVGAKAIAREAEAENRAISLERLEQHEASRRENVTRLMRRPELVLEAVAREKSVFDECDIGRYLHRYVDDAGAFQNLMARVLASPENVRIEAGGLDVETGLMAPDRYATREMIRLEHGMAHQARHLSGDGRFGVAVPVLDRVFSQHQRLSEEQRAAVSAITGDARLSIVVGRAGAGKTTMMRAAREAWEAQGWRVVGGALAGKAAEGLEREAGIASRTLASWQLQWEKGRLHLDNRTVFVLDEAGMVASRQMAEFVDTIAHAGAKLVLVGDAEQLQPIEAGAAFRSLCSIAGFSELGTIHRQQEQWMRDVSMALARGDVENAVSAYARHGAVRGTLTKADAREQIIADWIKEYDAAKSSLILAHLRDDVRTLNEMARAALIERDLIGAGHGFVTADGAREFSVGEQVVFLKNEGSLGVKNGMLGRVVEAERGKVVVEVGDDKRRVPVDQTFYRNIDHGYATTIHKSQGATVDRVKVLATLSLDRHLTYVGMTRHREDLGVYYGRRSFELNGGLAANLSKYGAKNTTLDLAGGALYGAALAYAYSRGLHGARVARAFAQNQVRAVREMRDRLEAASAKLKSLWASVRHPLTRDAEALRQPRAPWLAGVRTWPRAVSDEVQARMAQDANVTAAWALVSRRLSDTFVAPREALKAMEIERLVIGPEADRAAAQTALMGRLAQPLDSLGQLRGKTGLFASRADKQERQRAEARGPVIQDAISAYVRQRADFERKSGATVERERTRAGTDIPSLSAPARQTLERMSEAVGRGDVVGALDLLRADQKSQGELRALKDALDLRFGARAFLSRAAAGGQEYEKASNRVAEGDRSQLAKTWPLFHALQKVAAMERTEARSRVQEQGSALDRDLGL